MAVNDHIFIQTFYLAVVGEKKFSVGEFKSIYFSISKLLILGSGLAKQTNLKQLNISV